MLCIYTYDRKIYRNNDVHVYSDYKLFKETYDPKSNKLYIRHRYGVIKDTNLNFNSREDIYNYNSSFLSNMYKYYKRERKYEMVNMGTIISTLYTVGMLSIDVMVQEKYYKYAHRYMSDYNRMCKFVPSIVHMYFYQEEKYIFPRISKRNLSTSKSNNDITSSTSEDYMIFDIIIQGPYKFGSVYVYNTERSKLKLIDIMIDMFKTNNPLYVSIPSSHWHKLGYKDIYIEYI